MLFATHFTFVKVLYSMNKSIIKIGKNVPKALQKDKN